MTWRVGWICVLAIANIVYSHSIYLSHGASSCLM